MVGGTVGNGVRVGPPGVNVGAAAITVGLAVTGAVGDGFSGGLLSSPQADTTNTSTPNPAANRNIRRFILSSSRS
jgi:hypothetical protein